MARAFFGLGLPFAPMRGPPAGAFDPATWLLGLLGSVGWLWLGLAEFGLAWLAWLHRLHWLGFVGFSGFLAWLGLFYLGLAYWLACWLIQKLTRRQRRSQPGAE